MISIAAVAASPRSVAFEANPLSSIVTPAESCPSSPVQPPHPSQPLNDSKDRHRLRSPETKTKHGNLFFLPPLLGRTFEKTSSPPRRLARRSHQSYQPQLLRSSIFRCDSLLQPSHRHRVCVPRSLSWKQTIRGISLAILSSRSLLYQMVVRVTFLKHLLPSV